MKKVPPEDVGLDELNSTSFHRLSLPERTKVKFMSNVSSEEKKFLTRHDTSHKSGAFSPSLKRFHVTRKMQRNSSESCFQRL
jgi:hypothetical protein